MSSIGINEEANYIYFSCYTCRHSRYLAYENFCREGNTFGKVCIKWLPSKSSIKANIKVKENE